MPSPRKLTSADQARFDLLWNQYRSKMEEILRGEVKSEEVVEEALGQAALKACENFAQFDEGKGDFGSWILGIAHRELNRYFKKRAAEKTNRDESIKEAASIELNVEETRAYEPAIEIERTIVASFSAKHQKIYEAGKEADGDEYATELAKELGMTASGVRSTYLRLKKQVADALTKADLADSDNDPESRKIQAGVSKIAEAAGHELTEEEKKVILNGDGQPSTTEAPLQSKLGDRGVGPPKYFSTGFAPLDKLLGGRGLVQGWSVIIRGQPGTGKTTLALQIARHAVQLKEYALVYASVEDDPAVLLNQVTQSYWNCDYRTYLGQSACCEVRDLTGHFDREVSAEAKQATHAAWSREAGLTEKDWNDLPPAVLERLFLVDRLQEAEQSAKRKRMSEMDLEPVLSKLWHKLDTGGERPIVLVIDSLNALIHSAAVRFRSLPERQIMLAILHSFRNWRASRHGTVTVLFLVEEDSRIMNAAASYAADVVIELQKQAMEHTIYEAPGAPRQWRQEMRFCKVSKGRGMPIQSRSCCYEFVKGKKSRKHGGIVFLPTYAASGLVSLFQENGPMLDVIRTLRANDVPSLYPQVVVQEFSRTALQRVFSVSRRRTKISLRHPMMLSNVDEYWLKVLYEKGLLARIPANKLEVFSLPLEEVAGKADGTRFIKELASPDKDMFPVKKHGGKTYYYGVPQIANVGMLVYRKDVLEKIRVEPPKTWEDLEQICDDLKGRSDQPKKLFLETTSYDTFLATALELAWSHGAVWRTVKGHKTTKGGSEVADDENVQIVFDDKDNGPLYLIAAMERLKRWIHKQKITPVQCSVDPIQNTRQGDWVFARHWYSTWIHVCTQEPSIRPAGAEYGVIPIPISAEYERRAGANARHHSAWGVWYLAILRGSENIGLGVDLINNLMTARKISERARSGAALPTVEKFYEITDENCPETDLRFNEMRQLLFADAKSRCDFDNYPRFARSFSAALQTLVTNPKANVVEAVRKAFRNIDPNYVWPKDFESRCDEFLRAEFPDMVS